MENHPSIIIKRLLIIGSLFFCFFTSSAQSILNEKEFYDSLKPNIFYGDVGMGINIDNDDEQKIFIQHDAKLSYATKRHLFEFTNNLYYNQTENDRGSNRLLSYWRAAFFRQHFVGKEKISEADFFPEVNGSFTYDESKGLNSRISIAAGVTYNMYKLDWGRLKLGTSIGYEKESWRIFDQDFFPTFDTLSKPLKDIIQKAFGINNKGNIVKDNWRSNNYLQFVFPIGDKVNINTMGLIQFPFRVPYENPLNISDFPVGNKRNPRITINAEVTISFSKHVEFYLNILFQEDKGQISPFAKKQFSNISQGITYTF